MKKQEMEEEREIEGEKDKRLFVLSHSLLVSAERTRVSFSLALFRCEGGKLSVNRKRKQER